MAVYTIELDSLIKSGYDIGLTDYPLPNFLRTDDEKNAWRDALNKKIIAHYRFNEICCTPPDRFKHFLNTTMNEIMPIKNLLYDALAENWKFYTGSSFTEVIADSKNDTRNSSHTGTDATTKTGNDKIARSGNDTISKISNNTSSNTDYVLNVYSDTPGQMLNIETDIANNTYASNATKNKNTTNSTDNNTSTDTTTYNSTDTTTHDTTDTTTYDTKTNDENIGNYQRNRTVTGLNGKSYIELFKQYYEAVKNIDMEVIAELAPCFMGVF